MSYKIFWAVALGVLILLHFAKHVARALDHTPNRDRWIFVGSVFEALAFIGCIIGLILPPK